MVREMDIREEVAESGYEVGGETKHAGKFRGTILLDDEVANQPDGGGGFDVPLQRAPELVRVGVVDGDSFRRVSVTIPASRSPGGIGSNRVEPDKFSPVT